MMQIHAYAVHAVRVSIVLHGPFIQVPEDQGDP